MPSPNSASLQTRNVPCSLLLKSSWTCEDLTPRRETAIDMNEFYDPQLEITTAENDSLYSLSRFADHAGTCVQWSWSKGNTRRKTKVSFTSYSGQFWDNPNSRSYIFKYTLSKSSNQRDCIILPSRAPNTPSLHSKSLVLDTNYATGGLFYELFSPLLGQFKFKNRYNSIKVRRRCVYLYSCFPIAYKFHLSVLALECYTRIQRLSPFGSFPVGPNNNMNFIRILRNNHSFHDRVQMSS